MDRMNKLEEKEISRTDRNKSLYENIYSNKSLVELGTIMQDDEQEIPKDSLVNDDIPVKDFHYEEKNYDLDDFLKSKRQNRILDNLPRSLGDNIKISQDEINKIVEGITQKDKEEEFFADLLPDNENTIITEKIKDDKLDNVISDTMINNFLMNKDINLTNSFMDIEDKPKNKKKRRKGPLIIFLISLVLLIGLAIYLIVTKFL